MDYGIMAVTFVALLICIIGGASMENGVVYGYDTYLSNPTIFPPTETNVSLIRFYLWTRENQVEEDYDELFVGDEESTLNSHFDGRKKTKILAHGFTSSGLTSFVRNAREAYLEKGKIIDLYLQYKSVIAWAISSTFLKNAPLECAEIIRSKCSPYPRAQKHTRTRYFLEDLKRSPKL